MIEAPEVEAHRHKTGHAHVDMILGGLAVVLSLVSVGLAYEHGRTMEKLVEANTWPNIDFQTGNSSDGKDVISLSLRNTGVGPARIETMEVFYKDKPQPNAVAMLHACCATADAHLHIGIDDTMDLVLPAREQIDFLKVPATINKPEIWQALNRERFNLRIRACYCSVFDECYVTDSSERRPFHVKACEATQPVQYRTCGAGTATNCDLAAP